MNENLTNKKKERELFSPYQIFIGRLLERVCLAIIHWGVFLILFTPLIFSEKFFFPFVGLKSLYFFGLVEIIFFTYLVLISFSLKYRPKINILLISIILFVVFSLISSIFGQDLFHSFWSKYSRMTGLLMWFHLLAFFIITSFVLKKEEWIRIFEISTLVAVSIGILSILPRFGINPLDVSGVDADRGGATLGNSSFLASYLLLNVFLSLYLFAGSLYRKSIISFNGIFSIFGEKLKIIFYGIIFTLINAALFLSTGRAATISFFIGMVLLLLIKVIFYGNGKLKLLGKFLLTFFLIGLLGLIFFSTGENLINKILSDKLDISSTSIQSRFFVWNIGIDAWKEKPLLGWGLENFDKAYFKHFESKILLPEYGGDIWYDKAHNIVADLLVTNGLIGLMSYIGIFVSAFYVSWKKFINGKIDFLTFGIFPIALISYFIQNLTVFDTVSSLMMFFIVLGFIGSIASKKENEIDKKNSTIKPLVVSVILIFFLISFFNFFIQPLRTDYYVVKAFKQNKIEERISLAQKSLSISPLGKHQIREAFEQDIDALAQPEIFQKIPIDTQKKLFEFLAGELEKSITESPQNYPSYVALGRVYNVYSIVDNSKINRAEEVVQKAIEISPGNQQGYWVLAQTNLVKNNFQGAFDLYKRAIELEPKAKESYLIAIQAGEMVKNYNGDESYMQEIIKMALEINPAWEVDINLIIQ